MKTCISVVNLAILKIKSGLAESQLFKQLYLAEKVEALVVRLGRVLTHRVPILHGMEVAEEDITVEVQAMPMGQVAVAPLTLMELHPAQPRQAKDPETVRSRLRINFLVL